MPAAGFRVNDELYDLGSNGRYWSRTLHSDYSGYAYGLYFNSGHVHWFGSDRHIGHSVRAVRVQ